MEIHSHQKIHLQKIDFRKLGFDTFTPRRSFSRESLAVVEIQPPIGSSRTRILFFYIAVHLHLGCATSGRICDLALHCLLLRLGVSWARAIENTWRAVKLHSFTPGASSWPLPRRSSYRNLPCLTFVYSTATSFS
jgi:hypothetical protein